jgi:hypothetical protein
MSVVFWLPVLGEDERCTFFHPQILFMTVSIVHHRLWIIRILIFSGLFITSCQKIDTWLQDNGFDDGSSSEALLLNADVAHDWYNMQIQTILYNPPVTGNSGRSFALTGITLYETIRSGIPKSISLSESVYQMPETPSPDKHQKISLLVAANAALAAITRDLYVNANEANKASFDSLENAYNDRLKNDCSADVFAASQKFGRDMAALIFEWCKGDKFDHANDPYTPPTFLGAWEPTPVLFAPALLPYAGNCRPFLKAHTEGVIDPPPFPYSEDKSSDFFKMAKDIYDVNKNLTDEQRNIALFWNDVGLGKGYSPQGHAVSILNQLVVQEKMNLALASEAYAMLGMGSFDGQIMTWRSKYKYSQMRPVTYIRKFIDQDWLPLINTPAHPEYPAAHAAVTSASMAALASVIGDKHTFTDHTYDFLGLPARSFTSLLDVGRESGLSRRYGGIHYGPSIEAGVKFGQKIGKEVGKIKFK